MVLWTFACCSKSESAKAKSLVQCSKENRGNLDPLSFYQAEENGMQETLLLARSEKELTIVGLGIVEKIK